MGLKCIRYCQFRGYPISRTPHPLCNPIIQYSIAMPPAPSTRPAIYTIVGLRRAGSCPEHVGGCGLLEKGDVVSFRDALFRGEKCVKVRRGSCEIGHLAKEHVGQQQFHEKRAVVLDVASIEGGTKVSRRVAVSRPWIPTCSVCKRFSNAGFISQWKKSGAASVKLLD